MSNCVIVLGKNYSTTIGAIRSLGEAGFSVLVYYIAARTNDGKVVKNSKYVNYYAEHIGRDTDAIVNGLIDIFSRNTMKPLLIATDDFTESIIDLNINTLSKYFIIPHASNFEEGRIVNMMDKSTQSKIAESYGFRIAKSWIIPFDNGNYIIHDSISYPCFYKPLLSVEGGKDGMKKCVSETELIEELEKVKTSNRVFNVLVQEYLNIDAEYTISGLCFGNKVFLPAALKKQKICQSHKGTTICGIIKPMNDLGPWYTKLEEMLASLDLYSIVDIELFRCGEEYYFNEINFRTSAVCYGVVAGGANIPGMFAEAMFSGKFKYPTIAMEYDKTVVCEKAVWDDYIAELITKRELDYIYNSADFFIIRNKQDPDPEKIFLKQVKRVKKIHYLKLRVKKILGTA